VTKQRIIDETAHVGGDIGTVHLKVDPDHVAFRRSQRSSCNMIASAAPVTGRSRCSLAAPTAQVQHDQLRSRTADHRHDCT
jgi:hypothetical protein